MWQLQIWKYIYIPTIKQTLELWKSDIFIPSIEIYKSVEKINNYLYKKTNHSLNTIGLTITYVRQDTGNSWHQCGWGDGPLSALIVKMTSDIWYRWTFCHLCASAGADSIYLHFGKTNYSPKNKDNHYLYIVMYHRININSWI